MSKSGENETGRCWRCGYLLRGIQSPLCPECGRPFDRADRASMNFGRAMGRFGRWTISRPSRGFSFVAMAAAVVICITARWPLVSWSFSLVDLRYYADIRAWRGRLPEMTGVDAAYCTGLLLWAVAAAAWSVRLFLRQLSLLRYRVPRIDRSHFWRPSAWVLLWLLLGLGGVGLGWPYRIGQRWAANVLEGSKRPQPNLWGAAVPGLRPVLMTTNQELTALRSIIRQGNKPAKFAGIQLLLDTHNRDSPPF